MATIKKHGAPTRNTKGAIADAWIDLDTSKRYVCISSYIDSAGNVEYDWRFISTVNVQPDPEPVNEIEEKEPTQVEEEEVIEEPIKPAPQERRNNYGKPYNKHQYNKPNRN